MLILSSPRNNLVPAPKIPMSEVKGRPSNRPAGNGAQLPYNQNGRRPEFVPDRESENRPMMDEKCWNGTCGHGEHMTRNS